MNVNDMQQSDTGGLFGVIPSVILLDSEITSSGRLLYIILTWRAGEKGFCWHSNRRLGEYLNLSAKRVSELLSILEKRGHIEIEIIRDEETGQVLRRNIYPIVKSSKGSHPPKSEDTSPEKNGEGIPKNTDTSPEKCGEGIPKNRDINNKIKNKKEIYTPSVPTEGCAPSPSETEGKRELSQAKYKPEWFNIFYDLYPLHIGRKDAIKAWDKLKPSLELCRTMEAAIRKARASPKWQEEGGRYIPHPASWLNGRRWEDEIRTGAPEGTGGWAEDREVYE